MKCPQRYVWVLFYSLELLVSPLTSKFQVLSRINKQMLESIFSIDPVLFLILGQILLYKNENVCVSNPHHLINDSPRPFIIGNIWDLAICGNIKICV